MSIKRRHLYVMLAIGLMAFIAGCNDDSGDNKDSIRNLENNIKSLDDAGKINTFPLTIIICDQLQGVAIPASLQQLCSLSKYTCKTLPIAGILRLGSNNYYEYNCISSLVIPDKIKNNEADVTDTVERQVNRFLTSAKLRDYDSLLTPNHAEWNVKSMSYDYISNSADSIFFFSESQTSSGTIQLDSKQYFIFNDVSELRKRIDDIICKGQRTVSVFYNPPTFDSTRVTFVKSKFPLKGSVAGDTCISNAKYEKLHNGAGGFAVGNLVELNSKSCGFAYPTGLAGDTCVKASKYQKLHNGKGGFIVGSLIEANSKSCGFAYATGVAGDTCVKSSKYQKLHNGKGGFMLGSLIEANSKSCGFVYPTGRAGDTCVSGSKYQKLHNGRGGFMVGTLVERNSRSCGFAFATGVAGDTCINGSKYQKLHNGSGGFKTGSLLERNSKSCGFSYPAAGTPAAGFMCEKGSKYAKLNNGKGGYMRGELVEANSSACTVAVAVDNACANKSDPICEKDGSGNYTGRRVQYCYNRSGTIIRTIVVSRCDGDCRCLGK